MLTFQFLKVERQAHEIAGVAKVCLTLGSFINCGQHSANTCFDCPQGRGSDWCNGDCQWDHIDSTCKKKGIQTEVAIESFEYLYTNALYTS